MGTIMFRAFVVCCLISTQAIAWTHGNSGNPGFHALPLGGGGLVTRLSFSNDGACRVAADDTYGAWRYNAATAQWQQVITASSMPVTDDQLGNNDAGVYTIACAPGDASRVYMVFPGGFGNLTAHIFVSNDGAQTWTRCAGQQPAAAMSSVEVPYKNFGPKMAIDPHNKDHVIFGDVGGLFWRTTDGCASFAQISGIPIASLKGASVAFDPSSALSSGRTSVVYLAWGTQTNRVYKSTDTGATFSQLTGGPNTVQTMTVGSSNSVLWAMSFDGGGGGANAWTLAGTTWTNLSVSTGFGWSSAAIDPFNNNNVALMVTSGVYQYSTDGGATWPGTMITYSPARISTIGFQQNTNEVFMGGQNAVFDPVVQGRLWYPEGIGIWYTQVSVPNGTQFSWTSQTFANEELIADDVTFPTVCGTATYAMQDRAFVTIVNPTKFPNGNGPHTQFSASSLPVGTGSTTVTVLSGQTTTFVVGDNAYIIDTLNPVNNMIGQITSYSGTSLVVNITVANGSGTHSSWNIQTSRNTNQIDHAWSVDWASSDQSTIIGPTTFGFYVSHDCGSTWFPTTSVSPVAIFGAGGSIAAATATNWLWAPSNNGIPFVTTDAGVTWTQPTFPNAPSTPTSSSSVAIGTGSKTFTVSSGLTLTPGNSAFVFETSAPQTNTMTGTVTSYSGTTLILSIGSTNGSGTFTDWTITTQPNGWGNSLFDEVHVACADRVNTWTFYAQNDVSGFYKSTDGGATWTQVGTSITGTVGNEGLSNRELRCVPGQAGHLFFTPGITNPAGTHPYNISMYHTQNAGAAWSAITATQEVWCVGFGKAAPGHSYPAVYIAGYANSDTTAGVYESDDEGATFTRLTAAPYGNLDTITAITGDMNNYGVIYFGNSASGGGYRFPYLLKRDLDPAANDNTPMGLNAAA